MQHRHVMSPANTMPPAGEVPCTEGLNVVSDLHLVAGIGKQLTEHLDSTVKGQHDALQARCLDHRVRSHFDHLAAHFKALIGELKGVLFQARRLQLRQVNAGGIMAILTEGRNRSEHDYEGEDECVLDRPLVRHG